MRDAPYPNRLFLKVAMHQGDPYEPRLPTSNSGLNWSDARYKCEVSIVVGFNTFVFVLYSHTHVANAARQQDDAEIGLRDSTKTYILLRFILRLLLRGL